MKSLIAFCASLCAFALVAWLAGYDFDERNPMVALYAIWAIVMSLLAGAAAGVR